MSSDEGPSGSEATTSLGESGNAANPSQEQEPLHQYVRQCLEQGFTADELRDRLLQTGYDEDAVDDALGSVVPKPARDDAEPDASEEEQEGAGWLEWNWLMLMAIILFATGLLLTVGLFTVTGIYENAEGTIADVVVYEGGHQQGNNITVGLEPGATYACSFVMSEDVSELAVAVEVVDEGTNITVASAEVEYDPIIQNYVATTLMNAYLWLVNLVLSVEYRYCGIDMIEPSGNRYVIHYEILDVEEPLPEEYPGTVRLKVEQEPYEIPKEMWYWSILLFEFIGIPGIAITFFLSVAAVHDWRKERRLYREISEAGYILTWEKIPYGDEGRLETYLHLFLGIEWAEMSEIEKAMDGDVIRVRNDPVMDLGGIPGVGSEALQRYCVDTLDLEWAEEAPVERSDDGRTIRCVRDGQWVQITINEAENGATLRTSDGKTVEFHLRTERFLFGWDQVPGSGEEALQDFLKEELDMAWADLVEAEKVNGGAAIRLSSDEKWVEIRLDEAGAVLRTNVGLTRDLLASTGEGPSRIYTDVRKLYDREETAALFLDRARGMAVLRIGGKRTIELPVRKEGRELRIGLPV